jgi:hypothetical protein
MFRSFFFSFCFGVDGSYLAGYAQEPMRCAVFCIQPTLPPMNKVSSETRLEMSHYRTSDGRRDLDDQTRWPPYGAAQPCLSNTQ